MTKEQIEEKAEEIFPLYEDMDDYEVAQTVFYRKGAKEMAEWKDKQFEEMVNGSPQSMNEAEHKHWNKSPILWDYSDFKHKEEFIKKVEELINIYGIDAALNTPDYLLAEYILNCLILFGNTLITKDNYDK